MPAKSADESKVWGLLSISYRCAMCNCTFFPGFCKELPGRVWQFTVDGWLMTAGYWRCLLQNCCTLLNDLHLYCLGPHTLTCPGGNSIQGWQMYTDRGALLSKLCFCVGVCCSSGCSFFVFVVETMQSFCSRFLLYSVELAIFGIMTWLSGYRLAVHPTIVAVRPFGCLDRSSGVYRADCVWCCELPKRDNRHVPCQHGLNVLKTHWDDWDHNETRWDRL